MTLGGAPQAWEEPRRAWIAVQLLALSCHLPLSFVASNWRASASIPSIIAVTLAVYVSSLLLYWGLSKITPTKWHALTMSSLAVLIFWHWIDFQLAPELTGGAPAWILQVVVMGLLALACWRFANRRQFKVAVFAIALTLAIVPAAFVMSLIAAMGNSQIIASEYTGEGLAAREPLPDIYFVVLDGYARDDVLATDFGFDNSPFLEELEEAGFHTSTRATANYSSTHVSIPSMLDMDLPIREGPIISVNDLRALGVITSGDNAVVRSLKELGYFYVHGSSEWWGNRCGPEVDVCLGGPLMDITAFDLLQATPLRTFLFPETGDPGTATTVRRLEELEEWEQTSSEWPDQPKFVFLHVILPHPPLYLDAQCDPNPGEMLSQRRLNAYPPLEDSVVAARKAAYVEQVECANQFVSTLLEAADPDSIVVLTSDHGPDSRAQLSQTAKLWQPDAVKERMSTFTSMRLPSQCEQPNEDLHLVNMFRLVIRCIADGSELPLLPAEHYATPPSRYEGSMIQIQDPDDFIAGSSMPTYLSVS